MLKCIVPSTSVLNVNPCIFQTQIKGLIGYLLNFCAPNSGHDILVLTTDQVLFYDQVEHMGSTGPCKTSTYSDTFPRTDYGVLRPGVEDIGCMLLYNANSLDVITGRTTNNFK